MNEPASHPTNPLADVSARQRRAWQRVVQHPQGQFGGLLFCLLAGLVYIVTLVPGISVGDSVEMQWVPYTLGILHATGYPLYTLAGWFWSHVIPAGSVAYRLNAFSAVAGAAAVGLSYMLARRITRSIPGAAATALALLAAPLLWSQSVVAEVYALHALIVVSVLYLLVRWSLDQPRSDAWLLAAAGVAGLGLAHHRTILLLAPAALALIAWEDRAIWRRWRLWLAALALFLGLGLLPYLYIVARFDGDLARTLDVVTGASFWHSFVALRPDWPGLAPRVLLEQFGWVGVLTGMAGAGWLLARPDRRPLGVALALYALTQTAFALVYSVSDVFVFLLPVVLVYALWIGAGADLLWALAGRPAALRKPRLLAGAILVAAALALLLTRLPGWAAQSAAVTANTQARVQQIRQVAQRLPEPDAALDIEAGIYGAFLYQQAIDGQPVPPAVQVYIPYERAYYDQALAQAASRPTYLLYSYDITRVPARYRLSRQAGAVRVTAAEVITPTRRLQRPLTNDLALTGYDVLPGGLALHWQTARPVQHDFAVYAHYFTADLTPAGQQDKAPTGLAYYYPPTHWPTAEPLLDLFDLPENVMYVRVGVTRAEPPLDAATVIKVGSTLQAGEHAVGGTLGQLIDLLGYDLVREGEVLRLTLYWQARRPVPHDYTVSVQCVDDAGQLVAQQDQQPLGAFYPTSLWQPGEVIADHYELSPSSLCRQIRVGMYLWPSMDLLRPPAGDAIRIPL